MLFSNTRSCKIVIVLASFVVFQYAAVGMMRTLLPYYANSITNGGPGTATLIGSLETWCRIVCVNLFVDLTLTLT